METAGFPALSLIPLVPLLGAGVLGALGSRLPRAAVNAVALGAVGVAFAITVWAALTLAGAEAPGGLEATPWTWMEVGRYTVELGFRFDVLSAALLLVVTGVGALIHLYSTEYMHDDPGYARFFAYLNLFVGMMSILVLGANLPVVFIGWEGVGLASYLLIGFWFGDTEKAAAGKKAFIVNRIGDFGFLIGTFVFFSLFGTGDFLELRAAADEIADPEAVLLSGLFSGWTAESALAFGCVMLFLGACGKSAQLPLFVWLPDAMAGPTPVSALIHAATMVTSGVYLVCRMGFAFDLAPSAGELVAGVGAATAMFAATIGLAQNDIKKVLAYSTVSQLGYMFLAAGLGAYGAAMFHVVTHAFFKACLFLGSGAVIHALHGEQDMRRMGGLLKRLPVVSATFLVSTAAIAGAPLLSGFFSKDAVLAHAFQDAAPLWMVGLLAAGLTAFYMTRLFSLTFLGPFRFLARDGTPGSVHLPHWPMRLPLIVLAVLATFAGWLNMPHAIAEILPGHPRADAFAHWLAPATGGVRPDEGASWQLAHPLHLSSGTEWGLMAASVGWAVIAAALAAWLYRTGPSELVARWTARGAGRVAHTLVYGKWFVDEVYQVVVVGPLRLVASLLAVLVDPWLVDRLGVHGPGTVVVWSGRLLARIQNGDVQTYATLMAVGAAAFVLWAVS